MTVDDTKNIYKLLKDNTLLLSEVMIKLNAVIKVLQDKKIISEEVLMTEIKTIASRLSEEFEANLNKTVNN